MKVLFESRVFTFEQRAFIKPVVLFFEEFCCKYPRI